MSLRGRFRLLLGGSRSRYFGDGGDALIGPIIGLFATSVFADTAARALSAPFLDARPE